MDCYLYQTDHFLGRDEKFPIKEQLTWFNDLYRSAVPVHARQEVSTLFLAQQPSQICKVGTMLDEIAKGRVIAESGDVQACLN